MNIWRKRMQEQVACSKFFLSVELSVFLLPMQYLIISIHAHEVNQLSDSSASPCVNTNNSGD